MIPPKNHQQTPVFQPAGLLREARRQKGIAAGNVPEVCLLDPDGDLARSLQTEGARKDPHWACYHSETYHCTIDGITVGVIGCAVGAPYAVLVAEQLFCSGCRLLISVTSAGQISELGRSAPFILITRALRDEGTSHHYLPSSDFVEIPKEMQSLGHRLSQKGLDLIDGTVWTTDAPFRETQEAIHPARRMGVVAVEMEAAALYALGLEIESDLVDLCRRKAAKAELRNATFEVRDFVIASTGLADQTADYVMLFNILHAEDPQTLLREAHRILTPDGTLAIMHWNHDPQTPRGPSMEIRPHPEDCRCWVKEAGFSAIGPIIKLPPWHYGFTAKTKHTNITS